MQPYVVTIRITHVHTVIYQPKHTRPYAHIPCIHIYFHPQNQNQSTNNIPIRTHVATQGRQSPPKL